MDKLKEYFKEKSINSILDIATGKGQFIKILSEIFPDAEITGIDPDSESIKVAKELFSDKKFEFRQMSAEKLEFEDNSFDVVSISNGMHHLPELETSFSEMKRILKPRGYFIISEHINNNLNAAQENQKFYHHIKSYCDRLNGVYHRETWSRQEILGIVRQNGIKILLDFDTVENRNNLTETEDADYWVNQLKSFINTLKGKPSYMELLPKIVEFRTRIEKDGMVQATNVVIIGRVK
ncbi:MAG: methyltransferase domain-containing protein [Prolixibacteraceae bacterium]|nr:methyltransferase domain-containing protein [Prolixibacteraceae bacterium]MBN2773508.1 methyltransferase domain-containing protein [Prolixibacteraceae bacterium]